MIRAIPVFKNFFNTLTKSVKIYMDYFRYISSNEMKSTFKGYKSSQVKCKINYNKTN